MIQHPDQYIHQPVVQGDTTVRTQVGRKRRLESPTVGQMPSSPLQSTTNFQLTPNTIQLLQQNLIIAVNILIRTTYNINLMLLHEVYHNYIFNQPEKQCFISRQKLNVIISCNLSYLLRGKKVIMQLKNATNPFIINFV
jgi:hypothetical protein